MKNKLHPAKIDCVFCNKRKKGCDILCEMLCVTKGECGFFKTEEQQQEEFEKYPPTGKYIKKY